MRGSRIANVDRACSVQRLSKHKRCKSAAYFRSMLTGLFSVLQRAAESRERGDPLTPSGCRRQVLGGPSPSESPHKRCKTP